MRNLLFFLVVGVLFNQLTYAAESINDLHTKIKKKASTNTVGIDYGFFYLNYSCTHHGYNYSHYKTEPDTGNIKRVSPFHKERRLLHNVNCTGQKSTQPYHVTRGSTTYDRGHGVHQNIWDNSKKHMTETNSMANIVPQNSVQNRRGLWRVLEKRVECARDLTMVTVWLGNIWGINTENDLFIKSHGVTTPDFLWRIHIYADHPNEAYVWIIPNNKRATKSTEKKYRVNIQDVVDRAEYPLPLPKEWKETNKPDPYISTHCSLR